MGGITVNMVKCAVVGYYQDLELNALAKKIKDGDEKAIRQAAEKMSLLVKNGDILVPVPSHNGRAGYTLDLSRQIAALSGAVVMDVLAGEKRESCYLLKKKGIMLQAGDLGFQLIGEKPEGNVRVVDNVIASGNTARAAVDVISGATVLALADDPFAVGRRKDISIENLKYKINMKQVEIEGRMIRLYTENDWTEKLKEAFPEGMKIPVGKVDMDTLAVYRFYPAERWMQGMPCSLQAKTGSPDYHLNVEVRLQPYEYKEVYPNSDIYHSYELGQKTGLSSEDNEITMFLNRVQNLQDGFVEISLADERMFLKNLYVVGVQMQKAMEILLQHNQTMTLESFREALQLTRLKEEGVHMLEGGIRLYDEAAKTVSRVTEDFQHMYTGDGNALHKHPYYESDVKPKYDGALKEAADLSLRKLGYIETLPESLDVKWKNTRGDYWEAEQMAQVVNDMYRGYKEKIVDAQQDRDWTRVNIYTSNPEYRKRIMDTLNHSWAKEEILSITDLQDMPEEIASARQAAIEVKDNSLTPTFIGVDGGVYFTEKGTPGYVYVDYDRNTIAQGEPFTEKNQLYVEQLVKEGNLWRVAGTCLKPVGERREFLDRMTGHLQVASKEFINGKHEWVDAKTGYMFSGGACYSDITGRVTDAKVIEKGDNLFVRCKIDGVQQMAVKLNGSEEAAYRSSSRTPYELAVHLHARDLAMQGLDKKDKEFYLSAYKQKDLIDSIDWDNVYGYLENAVRNEELWALGSPNEEEHEMHIDNIERMEDEMEHICKEEYGVLLDYYGLNFFKDFSRITDINIYTGRDQNMYIRCKVDGIQQMAQKLKKEDVLAFNDETDRYEMAVRYFRGAIQEEQNREQGMKI